MPEQDCRTCKDWKSCRMPPEWFNYAQIRWCPYQVLWVLTHRDTLRTGCWPQDPDGSNNQNASQRSIKTEAGFVKPELVIAELETRLQRVGSQAELLVTQVEDGRTLNNLSDGARAILMYVKGFRRKDIGFRRWTRVIYKQSKTTPL